MLVGNDDVANESLGDCSVKGIYGVPKAYERSFRWKLSQFRYLCQNNVLPSHIKINAGRQTLFEDSYHQVMRLPPYELRRRLYVTFKGEEGLDYGGVSRYVEDVAKCVFCLVYALVNANDLFQRMVLFIVARSS